MPPTATPALPVMLRFVSRLSAVTLAAASDGTVESWIQVAIAGDYDDPGRYGKFSITTDHIANMLAVFESGKFPVPPTELCIDYDHLTLNEEKGAGDGKAAAWIRQLEAREHGTELWARVEWTKAGAAAVRDAEYRFFSPVIFWNKTSHTGEELGPTLFNGAITNVPFLQGMQPLALTSTGGGKPSMLALATLLDSDKKNRVDEAIRQRFASLEDRYSCWLVDTEDGKTAIFYNQGRYYRIGYAIGADGSVSLLGDPIEAVVSYPALSAIGGRSPMSTKNLVTLTATTGAAVQIDTDQIEQLEVVKALRAKLPKEGEQIVPAADLAALQANVTDLSGKVTALSTSLADEKTKRETAEKAIALAASTNAVDTLIRAKKATPAEKDALIELHQTSPTLFAKLTAERQPIAELADPQGSGDPKPAGTDAELDAAIAAQKAANPALTSQQAMAAALAANPKLYRG